MSYNDFNMKFLFDDSCEKSYKPVCKMSSVTSAVLTVARQHQKITTRPSDWVQFNGHCYKVFNQKMSHYQAQAFCPSNVQNSFLCDIKTQAEFNWIQSFINKTTISDDVWVCMIMILNHNLDQRNQKIEFSVFR